MKDPPENPGRFIGSMAVLYGGSLEDSELPALEVAKEVIAV